MCNLECFYVKSFEITYAHAYFKLYSTFDMSTVAYCQYYMGQLPVELRIVAGKLKFLQAIKNCNNLVLRMLLFDDSEETSIKATYEINNCDNWKHSLWKYFETKLLLHNL